MNANFDFFGVTTGHAFQLAISAVAAVAVSSFFINRLFSLVDLLFFWAQP